MNSNAPPVVLGIFEIHAVHQHPPPARCTRSGRLLYEAGVDLALA